jgi:hypothetical protein
MAYLLMCIVTAYDMAVKPPELNFLILGLRMLHCFAPVRGYPTGENLGHLARRYLDHPNSEVTQVDGIVCMEMGHAHRFKVVITLEISDVL